MPLTSIPSNSSSRCLFCPENADLTPIEIGHIGEPWRIRWFENKYPAEEPKGQFNLRTDNKYFTFYP